MVYLRSTARAERELAAQATVTMSAGYPNLSPGDPIHVYIDHSNLTIGGDVLCKSHGLWHMRPWNYDVPALRTIIMQSLGFIDAENHGSVRLNIYGADLNDNKQIELLRQQGDIKSTFNCPRGCNRCEKRADTQLTADMVTQVTRTESFLRGKYCLSFLKANCAESFPGQCVFVIVSGDSDMIGAMESAVCHGFYVHIWSWKESLSSQYEEARSELGYPERVRIHYLDDHLQQLTQ